MGLDKKIFCEAFLKIRDKQQRIVSLKFKPAQENLYRVIEEERSAGRPPRIIVLKGRQEGISTATEALMFTDTVCRHNVRTLIVAHQKDSTSTLFTMNKLFLESMPKELQPMQRLSNAKEILFENPTKDKHKKKRRPGLRSSIRCTTAGSKGFGRGDNFTNVHLSEIAFWPGDIEKSVLGIMQAVPDDISTTVVIESTANGFNAFKDRWDKAYKGENEWRAVFLPWFMEPEYRKEVAAGTVWTEKELELKETYSLDDEQLAWRRWCIRNNCGGDEALFRQEYPCTPDEAFIMSGENFFDNEQIIMLRAAAPNPAWTGEFTGIEPETGAKPVGWGPVEKKNGIIRIWEMPQKGVPYVLGGDTAGEGSDCFTAWVVDNRTGIQVAEMQMQTSEIYYARQIFCLGSFYNNALVAIEVNFSTYPEMKLEEWHYPNLYQRERFDTFANQYVKSFGWQTSSKTRAAALANLHTVMEEAPESVRSFFTLGEMLTFVYDKNRKPQAAVGQHDDLVMAAAICQMARTQMRATIETASKKTHDWTEDEWEDYYAADAKTRELLEKRFDNDG